MEYCTATRDIHYHDVLVAHKGDTLILSDNGTLINETTGVKIENYPSLARKWVTLNEVEAPSGEDNVNHPKHYTSHPSGIECITITRHYCFSIGNAIKYLWRAGLKKEQGLEDRQKEIEDLKKAIWYIEDRIKQLKNGK